MFVKKNSQMIHSLWSDRIYLLHQRPTNTGQNSTQVHTFLVFDYFFTSTRKIELFLNWMELSMTFDNSLKFLITEREIKTMFN